MSDWQIEWDDDGYPTEESLERFSSAPLDFMKAARFVVEEIGGCENTYARAEVYDGKSGITGAPVKKVVFATIGWSGNEELIHAAIMRLDVNHFLRQWNAGGLWQFEVPFHMLPPKG